MGRYTLFDDFLNNGTACHFEVLREMQNMGVNDDRLLIPLLFYLGSAMRWRSTNPFPRAAAVRMIELPLLLRKLQGHNYNIYECCFLSTSYLYSEQEAGLLCGTAFSLIAQILLLVILIYYNMSDVTNVTSWNKDWGTILVVIITTVFFAKLVYVHLRGASCFNAVFWKTEFSRAYPKTLVILRKALLIINIFVNCGLGIVIVLFNIFFLLISEDVNEAVLNSLALFFILEMDDMLRPQWDDVMIDSRIAVNIFKYTHAGDCDGDVQVDIKSSVSPQGCYLHLLKSDNTDTVHFIATDNDGQLLVTVYWRRSRIGHDIVQFRISGANGRNFFESIKEFYCVQKEIHLAQVDWWSVTEYLVDWSDWTEELEEGVWEHYEWG